MGRKDRVRTSSRELAISGALGAARVGYHPKDSRTHYASNALKIASF
jgi:hypothetical protein